jgi:cardiolipin synthase
MDTLTVDVATTAFSLLGLVVACTLVGVVLALATDDRDPSVVLAWLLVILLVPVLGVVAYFFIGRNYRRESRRRHEPRVAMAELAERSLGPVVTAAQTFTEAAVKGLTGTPGQRLESTGRQEGGSVVLPADDVRLYFSGADKFHDLFVDMRSARQHIHLMYLIWERDELTSQVTDILLERLHAGVEVRILYDWLSSLPYKKDELERLSAAGASVVPCYKRLGQLNYRNHMKMAIIDAETVYSGGMNMGQEYIDGGKRFDVWRDTHFRMTGPAVAPYLSLFASTWLLTGRSEDLFTAYMCPASVHGPGEGVPVQVLHSSVSTPLPTIRDVFIAGLLNARQQVWVQSPYFVPDEPLVTAMCVAASSGVDVRFMMTGVPDKKLPFYAAHAYYKKLLDAGVRVYQYRAGFLHAKTVTVDDEVAIVGTCNWDIRSIILHDEVVSVFYDKEIARIFADRYERDMADCLEVTFDDLSALSALQRLRNSIYRLTSRLL